MRNSVLLLILGVISIHTTSVHAMRRQPSDLEFGEPVTPFPATVAANLGDAMQQSPLLRSNTEPPQSISATSSPRTHVASFPNSPITTYNNVPQLNTLGRAGFPDERQREQQDEWQWINEQRQREQELREFREQQQRREQEFRELREQQRRREQEFRELQGILQREIQQLISQTIAPLARTLFTEVVRERLPQEKLPELLKLEFEERSERLRLEFEEPMERAVVAAAASIPAPLWKRNFYRQFRAYGILAGINIAIAAFYPEFFYLSSASLIQLIAHSFSRNLLGYEYIFYSVTIAYIGNIISGLLKDIKIDTINSAVTNSTPASHISQINEFDEDL
jgi:hypothetical protein